MGAGIFYVDFSADNSVRMALADKGQRPPPPAISYCHKLSDLDAEIGRFLTAHGDPELMGAALSVCGWERDGVFEMPNHSYQIDREWVRKRLGVSRVHLVNDIVAAALSIDLLGPSELVTVHAGVGDPSLPRALLGVGRSLGTTIIIRDEFGGPMALPCAGGHCDLPAITEREFAVVRYLTQQFGHVSRVRALSTRGLIDIHEALHVADGVTAPNVTAQQIAELALAGQPLAREAVELAFGWLAATAADTVLAAGARGGIVLAGTFFKVLDGLLSPLAFAQRFTDKGRLSDMLKATPVYMITAAEPEMIGLSTLFSDS